MNIDQQLQLLIDRYFDGLTTLDEERRLRRLLSEPHTPTEATREALAVISFTHHIEHKQTNVAVARKKKLRLHPLVKLSAAAAVLAVVGASIFSLWKSDITLEQNSAATYYAHIGGSRIVDHDEIEQLMFEQLSEINQASDDMQADIDNDLQTLSNAL